MVASLVDHRFPVMGTDARLVAAAPHRSARAGVEMLLRVQRAWLENVDRRLTRFRPESDLQRLNADPRARVPAGPLLRRAVAAACWAAARTGGLVDPTLEAEVAATGYRSPWRHAAAMPLADALASAPERRAARPADGARWRAVRVGDGWIERPSGVRLDLGGSAKGLAADLVAARLEGLPAYAVDCGGDLRVGGRDPAGPFTVAVEHPLTGAVCATVAVRSGAIATSGLARRVWRDPGGGAAHHMLDPATGRPAWTGLVSATALAPTAVEAEALAKAALLAGPQGAGAWLARHGGLVIGDDGRLELHGPIEVDA